MMPVDFRKILIANRGEIAVRIVRGLQVMGIQAMAVYSEPDQAALHVQTADEAYPLGGQTPAESYLNIEKILAVAKTHGADGIHPGYGFLSENTGFAQACQDAGLVFIGPKPDVIRRMGDKILAKETMKNAGVPVVPGLSIDIRNEKPDVLLNQAAAIGYPLLVKAAAGGGGKGMRLVHAPEELLSAVESAAREAQNAFGDPRVFLEKYLIRPRHIEIQIFGEEMEGQYRAVHLFERECSIQRRHQKIVEESPSPFLTPELRQAMGSAAIRAAEAIRYTNAGTVEFIADASGSFYFLEVNTRLQVEHPVTEWVTGQDLVRAQILVAQGYPMPFEQSTLHQHGHALECRIYAEDPANHFLPGIGRLLRYEPPSGPYIRVDSGISQGSEVTVYYDPMLAKLVTWGTTRAEAVQRMHWALCHYIILGVTTNIAFLQALMLHPAFQTGDLHTHFLEEHAISFEPEISPLMTAMAGLAAELLAKNPHRHSIGNMPLSRPEDDPWMATGRWRSA